jgi:hypothetical protein
LDISLLLKYRYDFPLIPIKGSLLLAVFFLFSFCHAIAQQKATVQIMLRYNGYSTAQFGKNHETALINFMVLWVEKPGKVP